MPSTEETYWFRQVSLGRYQIVHWKGLVAVLVFLVAAIGGMGLETWLKQLGSSALYYLVMLPFCLLVLACVAYAANKVDRR